MTRILLNFGLCLALCGALALAAGGGCPDKNGRYAVPGSCDAYIECRDGVPEEKTCPDGLLFNEKTALGYPCGYPIEVDCQQNTRLQSAQPTDDCPHQFGYFRMGDSSHCGQFLNCVDGRAYIVDCPEGLAWNAETYQCDWPDVVKDCDAEAFLGFKCPDIAKSELLGSEEYRFYPSPSDCQRYFICINGSPRLHNCGEGNGFNPEINACDGLENVTCSGSVRPQIKSQPIQQAPQRGQASNIASAYTQPGRQQQQPLQQPGRQQQAQRGGSYQQQQQQQQRGAYQQPQGNPGRPNYG